MLTKVHIVKAMIFPVAMYGYDSWTINKAEHWRIDAFELWCWTATRSNQSILKETSPEYSLEGLMLKLKLHYFGHLMKRAYSLEKILMLGKIEGRRRTGQQRTRWLDDITDSMNISFSKLREMGKDRGAWRAAVHGVTKSQAGLSNWRTTINQSKSSKRNDMSIDEHRGTSHSTLRIKIMTHEIVWKVQSWINLYGYRTECIDDQRRTCDWKGTPGPCYESGYFESCKACLIYMPKKKNAYVTFLRNLIHKL